MSLFGSAHSWKLLIGSVILILLLDLGCAPPRGVYHTVEPGQTLYQISRSYEVEVSDLMRVNGIKDPTQLRAGTRLLIPGAERKRVVPVTALENTSSKGGQPTKVTPEHSRQPPVPVKNSLPAKIVVAGKKADNPAPSLTESPKFIWPLKGQIIRKFSMTGNPPSKGIEIAVASGTSVVAVGPGQVIYSGNGISSFGNLIILKHEADFFSVYGYNRKNLVKAGSFVGKGDRIALSGTPPSKGQPRLYFEIRVGKEAKDPIFFLP